jgi:hypothetical protein
MPVAEGRSGPFVCLLTSNSLAPTSVIQQQQTQLRPQADLQQVKVVVRAFLRIVTIHNLRNKQKNLKELENLMK